MDPRTHRLIAFTLWLALSVGAWAQAPAPTPAVPNPQGKLLTDPIAEALRSGRLLMNYENIDIRVLSRLMSELTGKNLVLDDRVAGKITVLSSREVNAEEAWQIYQAALERYGFAVVPKNGFFLVTPLPDARKDGTVRVNPRYPAMTSDMTLAVVVLNEADAVQIQNAVRPMLSDPNNVQAYVQGRALVLADKAPIIAKVTEMIRQLDKAHPKTFTSVFLPQYAEAEKLAPVLQTVLTRSIQNPSDPQPPKVSAFGPTNAVVVQGTHEQIMQAKKLVERLDIPRAAPDAIEQPQFYVYFLQYAQAEDTAKILGNMLGEKKQQQQQEQQLNPNQLPSATGQAPAALGPDTLVPTSGPRAQDGSISYPRLPTEQQNQRLSFVSAKVASDADTNSLILFVSPSEYQGLKELLAQLDVPRRQVLVLAMVAEVSLQKVLETGAKFQVLTPNGVLASFKGGASEEGLLSFLASGSFLLGTSGGSTVTINVGGRDVQVPTFFAFIEANEQRDDFNLISSPRLLTNDNSEAVMEVGDVVPFATGAQFDSFGQPLITYDYKDVGIKLKLTPHVGQSQRIRIELEQQIQEVTEFLNQNVGGLGYVVPLISNRSVSSNVILKEGETLFIGGLVSKRTLDVIQKVPILGDIPLINMIFKQTRKEQRKSTLFIALTPYIIDHPDQLARLDRPYEEFLHGDPTMSAAQTSDRDTRPSKYPVPDPYAEPTPPAPSHTSISLRDLAIQNPNGADDLRQPRVVVENSNAREVELVLVGTVRLPDGLRRQFKSEPVRMLPSETREVLLPPFRFPSQPGVYEFDLAAWVGDEVVARIPLPKVVQVK